MSKKIFFLLNLLLALVIFIIGCSGKDMLTIKSNAEKSIKEIITSKGKNYNFLDDNIYLDNIDIFIKSLISQYPNSQVNYSVGNLDDDNIPEIVIFLGKNPEDIEDEGSLKVYKFNGEKYTVLDTVSMNFDVSNYQIEIGNISETEKGIFLNNNIGQQSGMTYGFILEEGELKSILNSKKINLVSIFARNQIRDINDDGILEFGIYTVDPETEDVSSEGSDKMTIWYKWNGKDSGEILEVDRKDLSKNPSDKEIYNLLEQSIQSNYPNFINELSRNKEKLSNYDNTHLLKMYIDKLKLKSYDESLEIGNLFNKYQKGENFDYIFNKYSLDIDKLNNLEYLSRQKVLQDEIKLKENIIKNINLGYKLNTQEGMYYYLIDYKKLLNLFKDSLTREYSDYLQILSLNSEHPFLHDGNLTISDENLVERILLVESFKMIYPYSDLYKEIDDIYKLYLTTYLYGDNHNSKFDMKTGKIKDEDLNEFKNRIEKYPYTNFADILGDFVQLIEDNSYSINNDIREKLDDRLN